MEQPENIDFLIKTIRFKKKICETIKITLLANFLFNASVMEDISESLNEEGFIFTTSSNSTRTNILNNKE